MSVKPQVHPGWEISIAKVKLAKPITQHGREITEAVSEISWTGGPLLDEHMDEFGLSLKLPESPGAKLAFPVIQECKKGISRWIEESISAATKFPAPILVLTQPHADGAHH